MTGDRIVEIDGKTVNAWTPDEVQRLLRGTPGSSEVHVTVEHAGSIATTPMTLIRAPIHQSAVRHAVMLSPRSRLRRCPREFSDSTASELIKAVDSLVRVGAQSLVVVMCEPILGELLEQGVLISELFLNPGQRIASTRGRIPEANRDYVDRQPQRWPQLRLAVVVNDMTASAAELFAGALQDHDRAVILGTRTFGKGSAQNIYPVDSGSALKLTTTRWFTPAGRSIAKQLLSTDEATSADSTTVKPPSYTTDAGRTVLGGGGIIPDVISKDTITPSENLMFLRALGSNVGALSTMH